MKQKSGRGPLGAWFAVCAVVAGVVASPSVSVASQYWRQMGTSACTADYASDASNLTFWGEGIRNNYAPPNINDQPYIDVHCPIIEDSVMSKDGVTVGVTQDQSADAYSSYFSLCKAFEAAAGEYCSAPVFMQTTGVHTYTSTSGAMIPGGNGVNWARATDFGFLQVGIGSRYAASTASNQFKGYVFIKP